MRRASNTPRLALLPIALTLAGGLVMIGCEDEPDDLEDVGDRIGDAADDAGDAIEDAIDG